jgi:hypothetical protein
MRVFFPLFHVGICYRAICVLIPLLSPLFPKSHIFIFLCIDIPGRALGFHHRRTHDDCVQFQLSRPNTHQLMRHHNNATPPEQFITLVEVFHQHGLISDEKKNRHQV